MDKNHKRNYFKLFLIIFAILLIVALWSFIPAIITGLILAYIFFPLFNWLTKKTKNDKSSASLTLLVAFIIVIIPFSIVFSMLLFEVTSFVSSPEIIDQTINLKEFLGSATISDKFPALTESNLEESINEIIKSTIAFIAKIIPSFITSVTEFILGIFVSFVIMFFALIDRGRFFNKIELLFSIDPTVSNNLKKKSESVIKTTIFGTVVVALVQGFLGGLGFVIFGVSGAFTWGFVMAILSVLPILGTAIIWVPASIYLIASGHIGAGIGLLLYGLIVISNIDNLVRLKIFSSIGKIHPVITLLGIIMGLTIFGMIGLVVGPLIIALFVTTLDILGKQKK